MAGTPQSFVSRRSFILGAGVGIATAAAGSFYGCAPKSSKPIEQGGEQRGSQKDDTLEYARGNLPDNAEEKTVDVVVIGSGIAGMSAALEAAQQGLSVCVLEKYSVTGGDSSICSGNYYCCGSKLQDSLGYTQYGTPKEVADFFYSQSDEDANYDICMLVAEKGGEGLDWLVSQGCEFDKKPGENVSDRSMLSKNSGKGIVDTLIEKSESLGVELLMETRAVELLQDGSKVVGVKAFNSQTTYTIHSKAVVIATGGFDGQDWSKEKFGASGTVGWHTFSSPSNTGDGFVLAQDAGAKILQKGGLSQIHLVGWEPLALNDSLSKLRMIPTGIMISDLGYRCANESMTSQFDYFVPFVQSGRSKFALLCDSKQPADRIELLEQAVSKNVAHKSDDIEQLAQSASLPVYPVCKTVDQYNSLCTDGEDTLFHKKPEDLVKLDTPPYYLVEITPNTNDSFGCLTIDTSAHVLDEKGNSIEGLFAAGTAANSELFYLRYAVSGSSLCMGTVTGRIAAQTIAKEIA